MFLFVLVAKEGIDSGGVCVGGGGERFFPPFFSSFCFSLLLLETLRGIKEREGEGAMAANSSLSNSNEQARVSFSFSQCADRRKNE